MTSNKIATCCYCGTRAALVLKGTTRHELACSNCGAPLHDLKMLRTDRREEGTHETIRKSPIRQPSRPKYTPKPKKKRRKSLGRRFFEEVGDLLEDIFD